MSSLSPHADVAREPLLARAFSWLQSLRPGLASLARRVGVIAQFGRVAALVGPSTPLREATP
ncbi:MAG: hypothetical protein Q8O29_03045 [Polaromonas sp.]|uniref:hypothetical protein n=1 Tax=Polaromonas sp. TaxID=1869339 RepID=UPI0027350E0B|nr:hypothetical protein [Polaromonas sp.]MDP2817251.1 hypothetical protein [Polaromonas sp.]